MRESNVHFTCRVSSEVNRALSSFASVVANVDAAERDAVASADAPFGCTFSFYSLTTFLSIFLPPSAFSLYLICTPLSAVHTCFVCSFLTPDLPMQSPHRCCSLLTLIASSPTRLLASSCPIDCQQELRARMRQRAAEACRII